VSDAVARGDGTRRRAGTTQEWPKAGFAEHPPVQQIVARKKSMKHTKRTHLRPRPVIQSSAGAPFGRNRESPSSCVSQ
jgi:hypothetical protein